MENYILSEITWDKLVSQNWEPIDKTFEFLCADFMRIKYKLDRTPLPSQNDNYPWIEWEPIEKEGIFYWYQSKFGDDAFKKDKWFDKSFISLQNSLDNSIYELWYLALFSRKDYPTRNRKIRENKFKEIETNNNFKIHKYFWNEFLSELKKWEYIELLYKYFPIDTIKEEIYEKCNNSDDICQIKLETKIDDVENWFEGDYMQDIKSAKLYQKKYSMKKLAYSTISMIWKKFEEIEKKIADEIFDELELLNYSSLDDYIDRCIKKLDNTDSKNKYKVELSSIMSYKSWLFVNYWTEWLSSLNYIEKDKIEFKDKRNG